MDLSKWKSIKKQQKITFDELSEKSGFFSIQYIVHLYCLIILYIVYFIPM